MYAHFCWISSKCLLNFDKLKVRPSSNVALPHDTLRTSWGGVTLKEGVWKLKRASKSCHNVPLAKSLITFMLACFHDFVMVVAQTWDQRGQSCFKFSTTKPGWCAHNPPHGNATTAVTIPLPIPWIAVATMINHCDFSTDILFTLKPLHNLYSFITHNVEPTEILICAWRSCPDSSKTIHAVASLSPKEGS